jgi:hypothetical protein
MFLFGLRAQTFLVPLQAGERKKGLFRSLDIFPYNDLVQENLGDLFFLDAPNGNVFGAILPYLGLVVSLEMSARMFLR